MDGDAPDDDERQAAVTRWAEFAAAAPLADDWRDSIARPHRLSLAEK